MQNCQVALHSLLKTGYKIINHYWPLTDHNYLKFVSPLSLKNKNQTKKNGLKNKELHLLVSKHYILTVSTSCFIKGTYTSWCCSTGATIRRSSYPPIPNQMCALAKPIPRQSYTDKHNHITQGTCGVLDLLCSASSTQDYHNHCSQVLYKYVSILKVCLHQLNYILVQVYLSQLMVQICYTS